MIQNLTDESFAKVCIDSGAGESVCSGKVFADDQIKRADKVGSAYRAARGPQLVNIGAKSPMF